MLEGKFQGQDTIATVGEPSSLSNDASISPDYAPLIGWGIILGVIGTAYVISRFRRSFQEHYE